MMHLVVASILVFVPEMISSQSSQQEWLPNELGEKNPQIHAKWCGHKTDTPAYICDPNGLVGDHLASFQWILKDVVNGTRCPCSNYYCETTRHNDGYHIGVALVKKMKIQTNLDGKPNTLEDQGQIFANHLESSWNMGRCEEDIIIFYSHDDKVLAIYGGKTAMNNLTPYYRNLLAYRVGSRFNDGRIVEALNNLLYDLKVVLNCDNPSDYNCGLQAIRNGVSSVVISITTIVTAVMFSLVSF